MKIKEAILKMLKYRNISQSRMAEKMGYAFPSAIGQMLQRGNVTAKVLARMAEEADFELVLQPKRAAGRRPEGQIVIDAEDEQK